MGRIVTRWAISMSATICPESGEVGINLSGVAEGSPVSGVDSTRSSRMSRDSLISKTEVPGRAASSNPRRREGYGRVDRIGPHGTHVRTPRVVLMLYATALALSPSPGTANTGFTWAFFAWGIGLVFVIAERLRPIRGP